MTSIQTLAPMLLVALALSGCNAAGTASIAPQPQPVAAAETAPKMQAPAPGSQPATQAAMHPTPQTPDGAAGKKPAGSTPTGAAADAPDLDSNGNPIPKPPTQAPQGIAVGEPNPSAPNPAGTVEEGSADARVMGAAGLQTPCQSEFTTQDANGDNALVASEFAGTAADFKAKDADADGRLTPLEFCPELQPADGAQPDGKR